MLFVKLPLVGLPKDLREGDAETLRRGFFRGEALPSKMSARRFLLLGTNILSTKKKGNDYTSRLSDTGRIGVYSPATVTEARL